MDRKRQKATASYPDGTKKTFDVRQHEDGQWYAVESAHLVRDADRVVLEDGTVLKDRWT